MQRRGFMAAMLAVAAAPAIVRAGSLMRINPRIVVPTYWEIYAQNITASMLLTQKVLTQEIQRVLESRLTFERNINRPWDNDVWTTGTTIRIAKPTRYMKVSGG